MEIKTIQFNSLIQNLFNSELFVLLNTNLNHIRLLIYSPYENKFILNVLNANCMPGKKYMFSKFHFIINVEAGKPFL